MTRRKTLGQPLFVKHPHSGEVLTVKPMDDGHFTIEISAGRAWAIFNFRSGASGGTTIGITTTSTPDDDVEP